MLDYMFVNCATGQCVRMRFGWQTTLSKHLPNKLIVENKSAACCQDGRQLIDLKLYDILIILSRKLCRQVMNLQQSV